MTFLDVFKHLLPRAKAWSITIDKKLRQFFDGLSGTGEDFKEFIDLVYLDLFPQTTRELGAWESQFGLRGNGLSEQERRDRLEATWSATGGQSPRYIQDTLQASGFDVYIHEWWVPGTESPVNDHAPTDARNPFLVINNPGVDPFVVECGEPLAQCGEPTAQCGDTINPLGYLLVNKILRTVRAYTITCGDTLAEAGELTAECGQYDGFIQEVKTYDIPVIQDSWRYLLYIGGSTYGEVAQVEASRKDEFEELCLKICPNQQWLGIIVEYI